MTCSFLLWLSCSNTRFFFHVSILLASLSSSSILGSAGALGLSGTATGSFPKLSIQSVSRGQLLGLIAVVGSHRALSGHSKQGQSMMVSMDAGSLLG